MTVAAVCGLLLAGMVLVLLIARSLVREALEDQANTALLCNRCHMWTDPADVLWVNHVPTCRSCSTDNAA